MYKVFFVFWNLIKEGLKTLVKVLFELIINLDKVVP